MSLECKRNKKRCKNIKKYKTCASDIESESLVDYFGCNEIPRYIPCLPPKDPCPLKSFCDPGLANTCACTPIVNPCAPKRAVTTWKINYLVSNGASDAAHYDPDLQHPTGIVVFQNQLWVANTMSDKITNYDLFGNKLLGSIQVRWNRQISSFPSGLAINCTSGFPLISLNGTASRPATIITPTKTGDVVVYNPVINPRLGFVVINNKSAGEFSEFTGIAIAGNSMYLANFFQGHIDVFDSNYARIGIEGRIFIDNYAADPIPVTYSPINIVYIAPYLYVVYAEKEPGFPIFFNTGPGKGFISVFTLEGGFVRRFYSRGVLNAPWSIIPAPNECGIPPGSFLVNNVGDGRINIFDSCGNFVGPMLSQSGIPITIVGLQSLAANYTTFSEVFFTSSEDIESRGMLGSLVKDQVIYI